MNVIDVFFIQNLEIPPTMFCELNVGYYLLLYYVHPTVFNRWKLHEPQCEICLGRVKIFIFTSTTEIYNFLIRYVMNYMKHCDMLNFVPLPCQKYFLWYLVLFQHIWLVYYNQPEVFTNHRNFLCLLLIYDNFVLRCYMTVMRNWISCIFTSKQTYYKRITNDIDIILFCFTLSKPNINHNQTWPTSLIIIKIS